MFFPRFPLHQCIRFIWSATSTCSCFSFYFPFFLVYCSFDSLGLLLLSVHVFFFLFYFSSSTAPLDSLRPLLLSVYNIFSILFSSSTIPFNSLCPLLSSVRYVFFFPLFSLLPFASPRHLLRSVALVPIFYSVRFVFSFLFSPTTVTFDSLHPLLISVSFVSSALIFVLSVPRLYVTPSRAAEAVERLVTGESPATAAPAMRRRSFVRGRCASSCILTPLPCRPPRPSRTANTGGARTES